MGEKSLRSPRFDLSTQLSPSDDRILLRQRFSKSRDQERRALLDEPTRGRERCEATMLRKGTPLVGQVFVARWPASRRSARSDEHEIPSLLVEVFRWR